jgi:hypothetical protein
VREWVERQSTTTGSTLTRRCAPASPWQGEASFLCGATATCKPSLRRAKRRRLLSLALARARERMKGEGVGRKRRSTTTGSTLTRRCAAASPCQGEAFLCCFVGNSRQLSVRSLNRASPTGGQCRGDPVGRPWCAARGAAASRSVGSSCTMVPGRRTASPLHAVRAAACLAPTNIAARQAHPV